MKYKDTINILKYTKIYIYYTKMLPHEFEFVNKFNKLFEYYFQKKYNITDKDKNYILTTGLDIMNKKQGHERELNVNILNDRPGSCPIKLSLRSFKSLKYRLCRLRSPQIIINVFI